MPARVFRHWNMETPGITASVTTTLILDSCVLGKECLQYFKSGPRMLDNLFDMSNLANADK